MSLKPVRGFSQNRISNIDTAPTFSITKAGAVLFSVSGNDKSRQIGLAKSNIQIKPCGGEEGDDDGRREKAVRKSEHEIYVERK